MTAIFTVASVIIVAFVVFPAAAEFARMSDERNNPIRKLRIRTRRVAFQPNR